MRIPFALAPATGHDVPSSRNRFGSVVGMSAHVFRDDVDAAASEAVLKAWLDSVYA